VEKRKGLREPQPTWRIANVASRASANMEKCECGFESLSHRIGSVSRASIGHLSH